MDFIDEIKSLASKIPDIAENISTEEATKNALVMPLINILGYNVFDPTEVTPEFTADVGIKKGEKVDYAIFKNGTPIMLIECKSIDADLDKEHASQLFRYFNVCNAKVGILTNGIVYRFYSDLDSVNKMDDKPFLEIDLLNIKEPSVEELKRFKKESFNIDELATVASELKYAKAIKQILLKEMASPSDDFVKYFAGRVYSGKLTQNIRQKFTPIAKNAFNQFINERINERLKSAMAENKNGSEKDFDTSVDSASVASIPDDGIVTTEEELEGYHIVKAILSEIIDPSRVIMRDTKSYCGILLDDNNRKPICRLRFNGNKNYVGTFDDENGANNEIKNPINDLNDLYSFANKLKQAVKRFDDVEN